MIVSQRFQRDVYVLTLDCTATATAAAAPSGECAMASAEHAAAVNALREMLSRHGAVWICAPGTVLVEADLDPFLAMEAANGTDVWEDGGGGDFGRMVVGLRDSEEALAMLTLAPLSIVASAEAGAVTQTGGVVRATIPFSASMVLSIRRQLDPRFQASAPAQSSGGGDPASASARRAAVVNSMRMRVQRARIEQAHLSRLVQASCEAVAASTAAEAEAEAEAAGATAAAACHPSFNHKIRTYVCAPSFVIAGAPKAATTSLFSYLTQHPDVAGPSFGSGSALKETYHWGSPFEPEAARGYLMDMGANASSAVPHLTGYFGLFKVETVAAGVVAGSAGGRGRSTPRRVVMGEASPGYLYVPYTARAIMHALPRLKVVMVLREPAARAFSDYQSRASERKVLRLLAKRYDRPEHGTWDPVGGGSSSGGSNAGGSNLNANASKHARPSSAAPSSEVPTLLPSFEALVDEVGLTMQTCKEPSRVYSIVEPHTAAQEADGCFVNPFVAFSAYEPYLKEWVGAVPRDQLLIVDMHSLQREPLAFVERIATHLSPVSVP